MSDVDGENATILSDDALSKGGMVRSTAWLRDDRTDLRAKKAAESQRRFRERMREEKGLVPVNLFAPDGDRPRSVLRGIARRMEKADYIIAAEVLVEDEDAYRVLSGSCRDLAIALTSTANDNLAELASRAILDGDLRTHLSDFAQVEASAREMLLDAVDDPVLWALVSRYRSDEQFRAACRVLDANPNAVPVVASFDAVTIPQVEAPFRPETGPAREEIAPNAADNSLRSDLATFSALDAVVRHGALDIARRAPWLLVRVAAAPELLHVLARVSKTRELRALIDWLCGSRKAREGETAAATADRPRILRRLREDPEFALALGSIDPERAAHLVAKLPTAIVRGLAWGLRNEANENKLAAVISILSHRAGWTAVHRLALIPLKRRPAVLDFGRKHGALVARLANDEKLLTSVGMLARNPRLVEFVQRMPSSDRFLSRLHRVSLAFKLLFGRV